MKICLNFKFRGIFESVNRFYFMLYSDIHLESTHIHIAYKLIRKNMDVSNSHQTRNISHSVKTSKRY